jgi:hypothetical protein
LRNASPAFAMSWPTTALRSAWPGRAAATMSSSSGCGSSTSGCICGVTTGSARSSIGRYCRRGPSNALGETCQLASLCNAAGHAETLASSVPAIHDQDWINQALEFVRHQASHGIGFQCDAVRSKRDAERRKISRTKIVVPVLDAGDQVPRQRERSSTAGVPPSPSGIGKSH